MFRTIKDVSVAEELTVTYVNLFNNNNNRKETIRSSRFFDCCCRRCDNNNNYNNSLKAIYGDTVFEFENKLNIGKKKNENNNINNELDLSDAMLDGFYCDFCGKNKNYNDFINYYYYLYYYY